MSIREISAQAIADAVERLVQEANCFLPEDVYRALERAREQEQSPLCQQVLGDLLENADIARTNRVPICQDTGLAVFFVELGQDVHITGGSFQAAMDEGVARGYTKGYLRKSSQDHLLSERVNRGDNTPAIVHLELVEGDKLTITACPKGGGSENMSALAMLTPSAGRDGVKKFILDTVSRAGANPCPPIVVGCAVGGTMDQCAKLAKKALLRPIGEENPDPECAALEAELLEAINGLGIGAGGFGGTETALAVHLLSHPVHLASLPVAVNIQCHAARHKTIVL
jgi:fumarate hydratase subunit alpha